MEIGYTENLWILFGRTRQDYPFILTGCSSKKNSQLQILELGLNMNDLIIPAYCHPVKLDLLLAEKLQPGAEFFPIMGGTISVPDIAGISGGVLGDPASSPCSAEGISENLQSSWSLITFPGGPGMAQSIKISYLPSSIQKLVTTNTPNHSLLKRLSQYTQSIGADKFIAVTDGSGPGACGAVLIRSKSQEILWQLEEVKN